MMLNDFGWKAAAALGGMLAGILLGDVRACRSIDMVDVAAKERAQVMEKRVDRLEDRLLAELESINEKLDRMGGGGKSADQLR